MNNKSKIKTAGVGGCLAVIMVLAVGLMPSENQLPNDAKNYIPGPPPSLIEDYGATVSDINTLKLDERTSWVKSPEFVPNQFSLESVQQRSYDELVTYVYLQEPNQERFDTLEANYKNGIVILFKDASGTDEFHRQSLENHIKNDPLKRSFVDVEGYQIYIEEAEDAYDKPARAKLFHDGKNIEAISSVALPMDLAKMVSSSIN